MSPQDFGISVWGLKAARLQIAIHGFTRQGVEPSASKPLERARARAWAVHLSFFFGCILGIVEEHPNRASFGCLAGKDQRPWLAIRLPPNDPKNVKVNVSETTSVAEFEAPRIREPQ